jgi:hypothetical protein
MLKKLNYWWENWKDDVGEFVAVVVGMVFCVLVCAVFWMAVAEVLRGKR